MLLVFCALLAAVAIGLTVLALRREDPTAMLQRRLERGDIHLEEYQGRLAMLRAIPEAP
ncbi:MAG TPA: hypothetical protein VKR80_10405 [Candidatus Limnocylindria bacterium]|nr:hypothetical protein [Candidatus Limnocylindria bacterium]